MTFREFIKKRKLDLAAIVLAATPLISGCGGGSSGGDDDNGSVPIPPAITDTAPDIYEIADFSTQANNPVTIIPEVYNLENNLLSWIYAGSDFLSIDPATGVVSGTPTSSDIGDHLLEIGVYDGTSWDTEDWNLTVTEDGQTFYYTISGTLKDRLDPSYVVPSTTMDVGGNTVPVDANGEFNFNAEQNSDGYLVVNKASNYLDSEQGKIIVNDAKYQEGKLENIVLTMIPDVFDMNLFEETGRSYEENINVGAGNGNLQRIPDENCPFWKAYININPAYGSGNLISQNNIDAAIELLENRVKNWTTEKIVMTEANGRIEINTAPPTFGTKNYTIVYWDDTTSGGDHYEYMEGDKIISNVISLNTSAEWIYYINEGLNAFGLRKDSNRSPSGSNDPPTLDDEAQVDIDSMNILYNSEIGNTSPDNNPSDYIINQ